MILMKSLSYVKEWSLESKLKVVNFKKLNSEYNYLVEARLKIKS